MSKKTAHKLMKLPTLFSVAAAAFAVSAISGASIAEATNPSSTDIDSTPQATQTETFITARRQIPMQVAWDLRAIRHHLPAGAPPASVATASPVAIGDRVRFFAMGYELVPYTFAVDNEASPDHRGVPVWFLDPESGEKSSPGILTSWIVLRTKSGIVPPDSLAAALFINEIPYSNGAWRLKLKSPSEALRHANMLATSRDVLFAHPDFVLEVEARGMVAEDAPYFDLQWNLYNHGQTSGTAGADINILPAWGETRGSADIVIADLDLGFEQDHPAMAGAWYQNKGEIPGNKIDDDKNGYKDDVSGWNFATNGTNLLYGASNKHGTATSGIVGARMNGPGTVGICPLCVILPVVVDNVPSNAAAAFYYAKAAGAAVITNSWGYTLNSPTTDIVVDAINNVATTGRGGRGTSIVFAMSNYPRNDCRPSNPDISAIPSVIAVAGSDHHDVKTTTSAFGPCLKILAPSSDTTSNAIMTIDRIGTNGYNDGSTAGNIPDANFTNSFYGTSAAAPQVSGVMALLYSLRPDATSAEVLTAVLAGADKINPSVANYNNEGHSDLYGYGRLNAGKSISLIKRR